MTDGSPTDCVRLAVLGFLKQKPDLVVSGINRGANVGDDITYSGTVAAAMEGLLSDIPSIAVSIAAFGANIDFSVATAFVALLAKNILEKGFVHDALLNVNVPHLPRERIAGVEVTKLGKRNYRDQLVEASTRTGTRTTGWAAPRSRTPPSPAPTSPRCATARSA
jgi:5'-nucleotidase